MAAGSKPKYYLVEASVLPEIFAKVIEAKELLETGQVRTVADAVARVDISRSAFYKYKDAVQPFQDMKAGHIITFYALLKDNPGVLSNFLSIFANSGAITSASMVSFMRFGSSIKTTIERPGFCRNCGKVSLSQLSKPCSLTILKNKGWL